MLNLTHSPRSGSDRLDDSPGLILNFGPPCLAPFRKQRADSQDSRYSLKSAPDKECGDDNDFDLYESKSRSLPVKPAE